MAETILHAREAIDQAVETILSIARRTLREQGTHLPTAILHLMDGMLPIVLPFKSEDQRKAIVEYVRAEALRRHAFAVTTVTCARIVDSRSRHEEEALVLTTSIQGGPPHVVIQPFLRNADRSVASFGEVTEGDRAAMPGQMAIFPDWDEETRH